MHGKKDRRPDRRPDHCFTLGGFSYLWDDQFGPNLHESLLPRVELSASPASLQELDEPQGPVGCGGGGESGKAGGDRICWGHGYKQETVTSEAETQDDHRAPWRRSNPTCPTGWEPITRMRPSTRCPQHSGNRIRRFVGSGRQAARLGGGEEDHGRSGGGQSSGQASMRIDREKMHGYPPPTTFPPGTSTTVAGFSGGIALIQRRARRLSRDED